MRSRVLLIVQDLSHPCWGRLVKHGTHSASSVEHMRACPCATLRRLHQAFRNKRLSGQSHVQVVLAQPQLALNGAGTMLPVLFLPPASSCLLPADMMAVIVACLLRRDAPGAVEVASSTIPHATSG